MTNPNDVIFRKWYEKFKTDNQVTFGLASEFKECWDEAQEYQASIITQLQADNVKLRELLGDVHSQSDYYHMGDGYAIRDRIDEALATKHITAKESE